MTTRQTEWNRTSYLNRKRKGMWLNRKQRLLLEFGPEMAKAYEAWVGMKSRTRDPQLKNQCYHGIKVCERWASNFDNFIADMGLPKAGMSIDRIDSKSDYAPSNCRWASATMQARNTTKNRISLDDAREIRYLYKNSGLSQQKIADQFGILQVSVSQIVRNLIWKEGVE